MSNSTDKIVVQRYAFYSLYKCFCFRKNFVPLIAITPKKNKTSTLDFFADRIKYDDWIPVLLALKQDRSLRIIAIRVRKHWKKTLEYVDTEDKTRELKKFPVLLTKYVLLATLDAISKCLLHSKLLSCLILEGIPLSTTYITLICNSLSKNQTIRHFSLRYCLIGDEGCKIICQLLKHLLTIQSIDLTGCNLTKQGASYIADILKQQGIIRYSEHWKQSLRYRQCDLNSVGGLRRITLNENRLKDVGAMLILERLHDDIWLKALDLQNCHITDSAAEYVVNTLQKNTILDLIDIRCNKNVNRSILKEIQSILDRPSYGNAKKYEWLNTPVEFIILKRPVEKISSKSIPVEVPKHVKKEKPLDMPKRKQWRPVLRKRCEENLKEERLRSQSDLYREFVGDSEIKETAESLNGDLHSQILTIEKERQKQPSLFVDTTVNNINGIFDVFKNFVTLVDGHNVFASSPNSPPSNTTSASLSFINRRREDSNSSVTKITSLGGTSDGLSFLPTTTTSNTSVPSSSLTDTTVLRKSHKELSKGDLSESYTKVTSDTSGSTTLVESPSCSSMNSFITLKDEITSIGEPRTQSQNATDIPDMLMGFLKKVNSAHAADKSTINLNSREVKSDSVLHTKLKRQGEGQDIKMKNALIDVFEMDMGDASSSKSKEKCLSKKFDFGLFHD